MIKTDVNKLEKGDTYLVLPGHNNIDLAIKKGIKKLIVSEGNYHIPYLKVNNTRYYLNEYLKRYNRLLNDLYIVLVYGKNSDAISSMIYKMVKDNKKIAFINKNEFYKNKKVCDISNIEIDDIYYMLINCLQNNYKYVVIDTDDEIIKKLTPLNVDMIVFNDFDNTNNKLILNMLFGLLKKNGIAIVNGDSLYKDSIMCKKMLTYGFNDNDYKIINYNLTKDLTMFKIRNRTKIFNIKTNMIGVSNMYILSCLFITLSKIGISYKKIIDDYKNINIPFHMENIKYKDSYIVINKIKNISMLREMIKEIKNYRYSNIYCMVNNYNVDINNYLNYHVNYLCDYNENNKEKILKEVLNKLKVNDLLLILELDIKEEVNT